MFATAIAPRVQQPVLAVREARAEDIDCLLAIENACFETDKLTRRSFHWMLTKAKATTLIAERDGVAAGYIMILYHRGTSLARMYSLAVLPAERQHGIAKRLVQEAEAEATERDCVYMRLEVRRDNAAAICFYERAGYKAIGSWPDYYEDHMEALRYQKRIQFNAPHARIAVPFYGQRTDFTCGPAALMMAMKAHDPAFPMDVATELEIWREATTIFMTSGHGGCGPQGLALAAARRGFPCEIYLSESGPLFLDGVRSEHKKQVMRFVHDRFAVLMGRTDSIRARRAPLTLDRANAVMAANGVPLVLVSSYRINRRKSPHWVVLTGSDSRFIYAHDPAVEEALDRGAIDCMNVPILKQHFAKMAQYGRSQLRAAVVVYPRGGLPPADALPANS